MPTKNQPVPPPEQIIAAMEKGKKYRGTQLANRFRCKDSEMTKRLNQMVADGEIQECRITLARAYCLLEAVQESEITRLPGRYVPPRRDLGIYDMRAHQRLCEGARNNLTGVV